jgi:hypothetical protein
MEFSCGGQLSLLNRNASAATDRAASYNSSLGRVWGQSWHSLGRHHIGVPYVEAPGATFSTPDVRGAASRDLAGPKSISGRVRASPKSFQAHDGYKIAINSHELDVALEGGKIDDTGPDESVENGTFAADDAVVWCVHNERVRPQALKCDRVSVECCDTCLVIQRTNGGAIGRRTLAMNSGTCREVRTQEEG